MAVHMCFLFFAVLSTCAPRSILPSRPRNVVWFDFPFSFSIWWWNVCPAVQSENWLISFQFSSDNSKWKWKYDFDTEYPSAVDWMVTSCCRTDIDQTSADAKWWEIRRYRNNSNSTANHRFNLRLYISCINFSSIFHLNFPPQTCSAQENVAAAELYDVLRQSEKKI